MKRTSRNFVLFTTMVFVASACNEKISPELQNSAAATSSSSSGLPTVVPSEYYFKISNSSPVILNYALHRTGSGRYNTDCKISKTVPLTNDLFTSETATPHDNKEYDITCFFEAEELSLYYNGFSFDISASPNTCEYVGYQPFSFFDRIPGSSTTTYSKVDCGDFPTAQTSPLLTYQYGAGPSTVPCNKWVDLNVAVAGRTILDEDDNLCHFDYSDDEGPNCDVGTVTTKTYNVIDDDGDNTTPPVVDWTNPTTATIKCGGKIASCINGPIKEVSSLAGTTRGTEISSSTVDTAFSRTISLPSLIGKTNEDGSSLSSTMLYANYRRNLATAQLDFLSSLDAGYTAIWGTDLTNYKSFDPAVMENYSQNKMMDGTTTKISSAVYTATYTTMNGYTAYPWAVEPFMGYGVRTSPFYTFYCFDRAFDVKARIRMVVRDWDKTFTSSSSLERLSDLDLGTSARQDSPRPSVELPSDPGYYNYYNDLDDWDDFLFMTRSANPYSSITTSWDPANQAGVNKFFDSVLFPNGSY